jgi:hypothetical protein
VQAAIIGPARAAITEVLKRKIWTAKLKIGRGAARRVSASRIFSAVAVIDLEAPADLAVVNVLAAVAVVSASVEGVLADGEAAVDGDNINVLNWILYFSNK